MAKCPTCQRPVALGPAGGPHRPFCSERCRTIDLGSWLDGAYRIGAPISEEDLDGGLPDGQDGAGNDQSGDDSSN
jgi:hypothetical protein